MCEKLVHLFIYTGFLLNFCNGFRLFHIDGVDTIIAEENEKVKIKCETNEPMAYCLFEPPIGKRFSFSGKSLIDGQCSLTIEATKYNTGQWKCHIGKSSVGIETVKLINVRTSNKLAAVRTNVLIQKDDEVMLHCTTTDGRTPLTFCRFESPEDLAFNIDSDVTKDKAILNKYYFPANKSLDRGDCAVVIIKADAGDNGRWICGAGLDQEVKEYTDIIDVVVDGITITTASATGITFGVLAVAVLIVFILYLAWRNRTVLASMRTAPVIEQHEMGQIRRISPRVSASRISPKVSARVSPEPAETPKTPQTVMAPIRLEDAPSEPGTSPLIVGER